MEAKDFRTVLIYENPSSGKRAVPCGRRDVTKLIIAFRNVSKATKKCRLLRTRPSRKKTFLPSIRNFKTACIGMYDILYIYILSYINTYERLGHTVAQMNQQTIVTVLLLTDNIISLRRSVLNKQMWDYS